MPKLWSQTIETHRQEVRDTILDSAAALVATQGLRSATMLQIAEKAGIGRATLYKYFPDVESILHAWHGRQIAAHLDQLAEVCEQAGTPAQRLEGVLLTYALIIHERQEQHDAELVTFLHKDKHVARAQQQLREVIRDVLSEGAKSGSVRNDVVPNELATFCLHSLSAVRNLPSKAAVKRLVSVILAGLRPSR